MERRPGAILSTSKIPDRYDILSKESSNLKEERPPQDYYDRVNPVVFRDSGIAMGTDGIVSQGPKTQLFTLRGPTGYTVAIPMRMLHYSVEGSRLTIELNKGVIAQLLAKQ